MKKPIFSEYDVFVFKDETRIRVPQILGFS